MWGSHSRVRKLEKVTRDGLMRANLPNGRTLVKAAQGRPMRASLPRVRIFEKATNNGPVMASHQRVRESHPWTHTGESLKGENIRENHLKRTHAGTLSLMKVVLRQQEMLNRIHNNITPDAYENIVIEMIKMCPRQSVQQRENQKLMEAH